MGIKKIFVKANLTIPMVEQVRDHVGQNVIVLSSSAATQDVRQEISAAASTISIDVAEMNCMLAVNACREAVSNSILAGSSNLSAMATAALREPFAYVRASSGTPDNDSGENSMR